MSHRYDSLFYAFLLLSIAIMSASPAMAGSGIILTGIDAEYDEGSYAFELLADNMEDSYMTVTPIITLYESGNKISSKDLGKYIILPNMTNTIRFSYDESLSTGAKYTISAVLKTDDISSNTLEKEVIIGDDGSISIKDTSLSIDRNESNPIVGFFSDQDNLILLLLILIIIISAPMVKNTIKKKTSHTGTGEDDNGHDESRGKHHDIMDMIKEHEKKIAGTNDDNDVSGMSEELDSASKDIKKIKRGKKGPEVISAMEEEMGRLRSEIEDLRDLHEKDMLDDDIYHKKRKLIENKITMISRECDLSTKRMEEEKKKQTSTEIDQRRKRLEESIDMLEKLYSDKIIDKESFDKNMKELNNAIDKLR